jgi:Transposase DDE domain
MAGGIAGMAEAIGSDMRERLPEQYKKQREGLSLCVATMLDVRSANLNEIAAALPREADRLDMRYQWITRLLGNDLVVSHEVMRPYAQDVLRRAAEGDREIVLIVDQTKANATHQAVMVTVRVGGRSLPVAWIVKQTDGSIGFADYAKLLDHVRTLLPERAKVVLMGDRFYGAPDLIAWCRRHDWGWRLRLKGDLLVFQDGGESTVAQCFSAGQRQLVDVELTGKRVRTNVGMLHEDGHPEPWFIAMSDKPNEHTTLDYGLRWGIEPTFSDFKSRGFGLEDSQLERTDRLDKLILVMTLALYWATSTGMWAAEHAQIPAEKKRRRGEQRTSRAA